MSEAKGDQTFQEAASPDPAPPRGAYTELAGCVCFNLRKASRAVTQLYDTALSDHKLRITQFSILAVLLYHGTPRRMSDLAHDLVMDRTTLTRNLRPLERAGLLKVLPGEDKRERLAVVTEEGRAVMHSAMEQWRDVQAQAMELLGAGRWPTIKRELGVFADASTAPDTEQGREAPGPKPERA